MSSIKNKNILFLGAVIIAAAAYGYYAFNNTGDAPTAEADAKAEIQVPVSVPVNTVEPSITVPAAKVAIDPVDQGTVPSPSSLNTKETIPTPETPEGEQK